ncbi:MAG: SCO family protein [Polyangiales bacterium]
MWRLWFCAVLLVCGCVRRPELPRIAAVPSFSLTDQNAVTCTPDGFRGKVWIASFMFTSCKDVCPLLTSKMASVRTRLAAQRPELHFVSFSVDPAHDSPEVLKRYARAHDADQPDWSFLTGPAEQVQAVIVEGFKQSVQRTPAVEGQAQTILHGSYFVLVDRAGFIRGYYRSDQEGLLLLERDARIVLAEKATGAGAR